MAPSGPWTVPTIVIGPGPIATDVDVVPLTRGSDTAERSGSVVVVVDSAVVTGGLGSAAKFLLDVQAASTTLSTTANRTPVRLT
jgi:hypothetical protein